MESEPTRATVFDLDALKVRLDAVRCRIAAACERSGREPSDISLVAVTKGHPMAAVEAAYAAGLRDFGENYVQESTEKIRQAESLGDARWHFIGRLQRNKVHAICGRFALIQTVDSIALGLRIARISAEAGLVQDVLIQVKLGDEPTKSGADASDFPALCESLSAVAGLRLVGLMAIAPLTEPSGAPADPRPYFAQARSLFERLPDSQRKVLSMGMSADFEQAIEEGSNLVRLGTALIGHRRPFAAL